MRILFRGQGLPIEDINIDPPANNDDSTKILGSLYDPLRQLCNIVYNVKLTLDY